MDHSNLQSSELERECDNRESDRQLILGLSKHIQELKKEYQTVISRVTEEYEEKLRRKDQDSANRLSETEKLREKAIEEEAVKFRSSWTWRIGSVPVHGLLLLRNFLQNPVKFLTDRRHRLKEIRYDAPTRGSDSKTRPVSDNVISDQSGQQYPGEWVIDPAKPNIGCIFDTFTFNCFKPEFNALAPTPDNWQKLLERFPLNAFIIESAWQGNNNSWLYQIGKYKNDNNRILKELVSELREKQIPLIFWNKEDPVHFDKFLVGAELCDYIFTTDADCIPKYQEHTGNDKVFALPFAAQEKIHNPIRVTPRDGIVCFAGTYYAVRYAERQIDMDIILEPSLDFGLDIYNRQSAVDEKYADQYRFPDKYQSALRNRLEYPEMVKAYRRYKVFLNVNSVRYSPTMFARRVFELLACGTPVISTYSKGISNILGEDTVFITESKEQTRQHLEKLIGDERFWWKHSLRGIRKVLEHHTYYHRTKEIFDRVGIDFRERKAVKFLVITLLNSLDKARYLKKLLNEQVYKNFSVMAIQERENLFSMNEKEEIKRLLAPYDLIITDPGQQDIQETLSMMADIQYAALFQLNHYYGCNYLRDYALAVVYSGAAKMGKKNYHRYLQSGQINSVNPGADFQYVPDVHTGTLVVEMELLKEMNITEILNQETFYDFNMDLLSIDPWNILIDGAEAPENISGDIAL